MAHPPPTNASRAVIEIAVLLRMSCDLWTEAWLTPPHTASEAHLPLKRCPKSSSRNCTGTCNVLYSTIQSTVDAPPHSFRGSPAIRKIASKATVNAVLGTHYDVQPKLKGRIHSIHVLQKLLMPLYSHGSYARKIELRAELRASFKIINMTPNIPTKPPHLPKSLIFLGRPPQDHLMPLRIKTIEQPIPYPETRKPSKHLNTPFLTSIPGSPILTIAKIRSYPVLSTTPTFTARLPGHSNPPKPHSHKAYLVTIRKHPHLNLTPHPLHHLFSIT